MSSAKKNNKQLRGLFDSMTPAGDQQERTTKKGTSAGSRLSKSQVDLKNTMSKSKSSNRKKGYRSKKQAASSQPPQETTHKKTSGRELENEERTMKLRSSESPSKEAQQKKGGISAAKEKPKAARNLNEDAATAKFVSVPAEKGEKRKAGSLEETKTKKKRRGKLERKRSNKAAATSMLSKGDTKNSVDATLEEAFNSGDKSGEESLCAKSNVDGGKYITTTHIEASHGPVVEKPNENHTDSILPGGGGNKVAPENCGGKEAPFVPPTTATDQGKEHEREKDTDNRSNSNGMLSWWSSLLGRKQAPDEIKLPAKEKETDMAPVNAGELLATDVDLSTDAGGIEDIRTMARGGGDRAAADASKVNMDMVGAVRESNNTAIGQQIGVEEFMEETHTWEDSGYTMSSSLTPNTIKNIYDSIMGKFTDKDGQYSLVAGQKKLSALEWFKNWGTDMFKKRIWFDDLVHSIEEEGGRRARFAPYQFLEEDSKIVHLGQSTSFDPQSYIEMSFEENRLIFHTRANHTKKTKEDESVQRHNNTQMTILPTQPSIAVGIAVDEAINGIRVIGSSGFCKDKYGNEATHCNCLRDARDRMDHKQSIVSLVQCILDAQETKGSRSVLREREICHAYKRHVSSRVKEQFLSVHGTRSKVPETIKKHNEELANTCKVHDKLVDLLLDRAYMLYERKGRFSSKPMLVLDGTINDQGEPSDIRLTICLNVVGNLIKHTLIALYGEKHGKESFMKNYHGSIITAECELLVVAEGSLRRDLFYAACDSQVNNEKNKKNVEWDKVRLNRYSGCSLLKKPSDLYRNWGLDNILVLHPNWPLQKIHKKDIDVVQFVKSHGGALSVLSDQVCNLLETIGSDKVYSPAKKYDGVADAAFHYKQSKGVRDFRDLVVELKMGKSDKGGRNMLATTGSFDELHSAIGNCLKDAVENNNKTKWIGDDDNFCIAATFGETKRQGMQRPHWDFNNEKTFTLAELEPIGEARTRLRPRKNNTPGEDVLTERDVGFIGFFPLTRKGMFLQLWPEMTDEKKTSEGVIVYIPFGVLLIVNGNTVHGGGFSTSPHGNRRAHFYAFNSKQVLATKSSNVVVDNPLYIRSRLLGGEDNPSLENGFFCCPFRNWIREGYKES